MSIAALRAVGTSQGQIATAFAAIGLSAILSGVVFWLAGRFRLGRLSRMFPYPVAAGFLASSGFLLVYSAFVILSGARSFVAMRRPNGTLLVVVVIWLFLAGFYGFANLAGIDAERAIALGLLPPGGDEGGLQPGLWLYQMIDWQQVLSLGMTLCAVVLINLIAVLLNMSGVEMAARHDVSENRELRGIGVVSMPIEAFGGTASFMQGGATISPPDCGCIAAGWWRGIRWCC